MREQAGTTRRGAADWLVLVGRFASLAYLNALVWLSVWVLIPTFFLGWSPMAIETGSMGPSISAGDVVLIEPYRGQPVQPGRVVTFQDPADPGRLVTHRVTAVNDDGTYATKGDANADADSTPLDPELLRGVGRLVVPRVGLPVVWATQSHYGALAAWAISVLFALLLLAPSRPEEGGSSAPAPVRAKASRRDWRKFLRRPETAASGGAPVGFAHVPSPRSVAPPAPSQAQIIPPAFLPSLPVPPRGGAVTAAAAAGPLELPQAPRAGHLVGWAQVPAVRYRMRLPRPPAPMELPAPPRWTVAMVPPAPGTAPVAPIPAPPRPAPVRRGSALSTREVPGWTGRLHS